MPAPSTPLPVAEASSASLLCVYGESTAVPANATNTFALWVGVAASGGAYRRRLNVSRRLLLPMIVASVLGGFLGALLLIHTPAQTFLRLIPWLMLATTLLFAFGARLAAFLRSEISSEAGTMRWARRFLSKVLVSIWRLFRRRHRHREPRHVRRAGHDRHSRHERLEGAPQRPNQRRGHAHLRRHQGRHLLAASHS